MQEFTETLGTDGVNPRHPIEDALAAPSGRAVSRRSGLLAGCIYWIAGRLHRLLLYNLIGLFTNIFFFHRLSFAFSSARNNHLGLLGDRHAGDRRHHRRNHGPLRLRQDSRPRNSGSYGGGAGQPQPNRAEGRDLEADLSRYSDRHRAAHSAQRGQSSRQVARWDRWLAS